MAVKQRKVEIDLINTQVLKLGHIQLKSNEEGYYRRIEAIDEDDNVIYLTLWSKHKGDLEINSQVMVTI